MEFEDYRGRRRVEKLHFRGVLGLTAVFVIVIMRKIEKSAGVYLSAATADETGQNLKLSVIVLFLRKGVLMKSVSSFICKTLLTIVLGVFIFALAGCSTQQPGETSFEGDIRHKRTMRINHQEMMSDIDRFLLLDEPSKLTERRIP